MNQELQTDLSETHQIRMFFLRAAFLGLPLSLILIPACGLPKRNRSSSTTTAMAEVDSSASDGDQPPVSPIGSTLVAGSETEPQSNGDAAHLGQTPASPQPAGVSQTFPDTSSLVPESMQMPEKQLMAVAESDQASSPVKLMVAGVEPNGGPIRVAVFTAENEFPNHETAAHKVVLPGVSETVEGEVNQMPSGPVAIAAFQDLNNDGILNRSSFGIPSEPYGFSNNARGQMGPPSFSQAQVPVGKNSAVIPISLTKLKF